MLNSDCLVAIDEQGHRINYDDFVSDPNVLSLYTELSQSGRCWRLMPMPDGWDVPKIIHVLSVIGAFSSGQVNERAEIPHGSATKRWRFVQVKTGILFTLGIENLVVVHDTGDSVDVPEGGYTSIYKVLYADVDKDRGDLVYDTRSFGSVALGNYQKALGVTPVEPPRGPRVRHINSMSTIYDEEVEDLGDRGVYVATAPDPNSAMYWMYTDWQT
jgi:hypothetical protein